MNSIAGRFLSTLTASLAVGGLAPADVCSSPYTFPVVGDVVEYQVSPDGQYVVFVADARQDEVFEIFSAPANGSAAPRRLNLPLPPGGDVELGFRISPDGSFVVFLADYTINHSLSLFIAPTAGGGPATRLDQAVKPNEEPYEFDLTADGTRVAYAQKTYSPSTDVGLYVVSIVGGLVTRLTPVFPITGQLISWSVSPDSAWYAYVSDEDTDGLKELFAGPLDGSSSRVKLTPPMPPNNGGVQDYLFAPDGSRILYRSDHAGLSGFYELWSVPTTGGTSTRINDSPVLGGEVLSGHRLSPDGSMVVFRADVTQNEVFNLYAAPLDGSTSPTRWTNAAVSGSVEDQWVFTAAADRVVYRGKAQGSAANLYSSPTDGSHLVTKLNGTLVSGGEVQSGFLVGAADLVAYRADQDQNNRFELYSVPVDGVGGPTKLHPTLGANEDVQNQFRLSVDGTTVVLSTNHGHPSGLFGAFSVPIDGSAGLTQLNNVGRIYTNSLQVSSLGQAFWRGVDDVQNPNVVDELLGAPLDGSQPSWKLNGALALGPLDGDVVNYAVSADGTRAYYGARENAGGGLYSVPVETNACATSLVSGASFKTLFYEEADLSLDGLWLAFRAQETLNGPFGIYVVPYEGGTPVKVSGTTPVNTFFSAPVFSPDASRVVYIAREVNDYQAYSAPIGGAGPVVLNGSLTANGDVEDVRVSPGGTRVVYLADQDTDGILELYGATIDGSGTAVKLSGPAAGNGNGAVERDWIFSPDGSRVLYRAHQDTTQLELYSVPIDGSATAVRLNQQVPATGGVSETKHMCFSADGLFVYYLAREEVDFRNDVYRAPIDGSSPSLRLNGPLVNGGNVSGMAAFTADDTRLVYAADALVDNKSELFVVPTDGSQTPVKINQPILPSRQLSMPAIDSTDQWVIATGDLDLDNIIEIYRIKADGTVQEKINPDVVPSNGGLSFELTPDRQTVVMYGVQAVSNVTEVFAAPADGSAATLRINGPLIGGGQVSDYLITPDSAAILYLADQNTDDVFELFFAPLPWTSDTNAAWAQLSAPFQLPSGPDVRRKQRLMSGPLPHPQGN